jgi:hypothetical protein
LDPYQAFAQYYSEQIAVYKDKDYIDIIKFQTELFGAYKYAKFLFPNAKYELTDFYRKIEQDLNRLAVEKDKES